MGVIFRVLILFMYVSHLGGAEGVGRNPKTLVLIICSNNLSVYKGFQEVWRSYMHLDREHFECYFLMGNPQLTSEMVIEKDVIWSRTEESLIPGILNKTLMSLEGMQLRLDEFDYVLRANLSSFIVFPRLLSFLQKAPREMFYCGMPQKHAGHDEEWVCGAGIIMSRDLARVLINNKQEMMNLKLESSSLSDYLRAIDDVVIGTCFRKFGVEITKGRFQEIYNTQDWLNIKGNIPEDVFHFRIKFVDSNKRWEDFEIQKILLKMFYPNSKMNKHWMLKSYKPSKTKSKL